MRHRRTTTALAVAALLPGTTLATSTAAVAGPPTAPVGIAADIAAESVTGGALVQQGVDDRALSAMGAGPNGNGTRPAVAANGTTGELLVVWEGDDPGGPSGLADEEFEIWGQRVTGPTGAPVGPRLRLSTTGPDGDASFDAHRPSVAWSPASGTWLVVWEADAGTDGDVEIWAQAVAADGALVGTAVAASSMGAPGDLTAAAAAPDVAASATGFLVTWSGDQGAAGPLADGEHEVFARTLGPDGTPTGVQQRISSAGPDGDAAYDAWEPTVVATPTGWAVAWWGDDDRTGMVDDEVEVFGRRLDPAGTPVDGDDVRLTDVGPAGNTDAFAQSPDLATDGAGALLLTWLADVGPSVEVQAGVLSPDLGQASEVRTVSANGAPPAAPFDPAAAWQPATGEWLVTWWGDTTAPPHVNDEWEVWAQRLSAGGAQLGADVALSDMGTPGNLVASARFPAVATTTDGLALVVWAGSDADVAPAADVEVHAQLVGQAAAATTSLVPLTPSRLLDTREGLGAPRVALAPEQQLDLQVAGRGGVPASGAVAVVLNVTAAEAAGPGFVVAWPTGAPRPLASNLNLTRAGQDRANLVVVPLGRDGQVSLAMQAGGQLVVDVTGWFTPDVFGRSGRFAAVPPARVFDTRDGTGTGAPLGLLGPGGEVEVQVAGRGGVPATGASAVVANVTLADATAPGYVTVWPNGQPRPLASTLNAGGTGDVVPNLVVLPLGPDGRLRLHTQSGGHLLVDVFGWFTDATASESASGLFTPLLPARVLDTRADVGTDLGRIRPDDVLPLRLPGRGGLPDEGIGAVVANLTATQTGGAGFVTAWPPTTLRPNVSNLNATGPGQDVANLAIVGLSPTGLISFYSQAGTHLVADVAGWFTG